MSILRKLAADLWWTTEPDAHLLWRDLDPDQWEALHHRPLAMLTPDRVQNAPAPWKARAERLIQKWNERNARPKPTNPTIAYFCMEYGLHEGFPIYSGGLGILAGDHLRSADDHNLDFVAVGFFWSEGYFTQRIVDGVQVAEYRRAEPEHLPIKPVLDETGKRLQVAVRIGRTPVTVQVWKTNVGRVQLFLLDTDVDDNEPKYRALTRRLYGGDKRARAAQEVLLGVGGTRVLQQLDIRPKVYHLNEGHAAFLILELWAQGIHAGLDRDAAWAQAKESCVFTTHTPVPAGHDRFNWEIADSVLVGLRESLDLPSGSFMDLGRVRPGDVNESLCMTVLGLRGSRMANGVSALHGEVSRKMWEDLGHPIGHITNGVHPTAWLAPEMAALFDRCLPNWREHLDDNDFWKQAGDANVLPRTELWQARQAIRARMVDQLNHRLGGTRLSPERLTIGFARRFAPYKRGNLILSNPTKLVELLRAGVQIIFAGKAHPSDKNGQAIVEEVVRRSADPRTLGQVLFVPEYDAEVGRLLTQGCDVWLNNPRRPREASGTSGQKASLNGNLNCSILDGWWPEAHDGRNGWAIGGTFVPKDMATQDAIDEDALYTILQRQVLPAFQDPDHWASMMAHAIQTCMPRFNTHRMVKDYLQQLYFPVDVEPHQR